MRVILITGAASGLGWQLARAYHARGDALLLTDIDASGLAARADELGSERVLALAGDITDPELHARLLDGCQQRFGRLDVLINNAGITHRSPTLRTDPAVFRKVMAVDYHAPLELTLAALPLLREAAARWPPSAPWPAGCRCSAAPVTAPQKAPWARPSRCCAPRSPVTASAC